MAEHQATVTWQRNDQGFTDNRYSRSHTWRFDGGLTVPASTSPHVVPLPFSDESAVDPEEAFIASLASCHMLWFLSLAARQGYCIDSYTDNAVGVLAKNENGRLAITQVVLHPQTLFCGDKQLTAETILDLHYHAHELCFIANSVKTEVLCEPVL